MKKVFSLVLGYVKQTFNAKLYLAITILLIILISFNYYYDFEDSIIDSFFGQPISPVLFFLVQYIPYILCCILIVIFTDKKELFQQKGFWFYSLLAFIILGLNRGAYIEKLASGFSEKYVEIRFYWKLLSSIENVLFVILPITLFYLIYDRKKQAHFYGLRLKGADITPYIIMLGIMLVPIFFASLTEGFQKVYPRANKTNYEAFALFKGYSVIGTLLIYEFFYLLSFVAVELLFRGLMIYGLKKYLGDYVVLPMVVAYAVLHFGKPLGETIGSIGGGYILGILALRTDNIYGGIFIHMGVALFMEVFAFTAIACFSN